MSEERQKGAEELREQREPAGETPGQSGESDMNTCPECEGSGKVDEDTTCPNCGGTGKVQAVGQG